MLLHFLSLQFFTSLQVQLFLLLFCLGLQFLYFLLQCPISIILTTAKQPMNIQFQTPTFTLNTTEASLYSKQCISFYQGILQSETSILSYDIIEQVSYYGIDMFDSLARCTKQTIDCLVRRTVQMFKFL